jgi:hypothetical protein
VRYNTCFDDSIFERLTKDRSPAEARKAFAAEGITHVYVQWGEIARYRSTYGFTDYVQPSVFDRLVGDSVLAPMQTSDVASPSPGHAMPAQSSDEASASRTEACPGGRAIYRVVGENASRGS